MKKLLSVFCALLLTVNVVSINAFAAGKSGSLGAKSTGFKFKDISCNVKYKEPSFIELDCDKEGTVFFSSQGKVELDSTTNFQKNAYISVRIKQPKFKRSFSLLHPTTFLKKVVPEDESLNRFFIQGPRIKAPFWHPVKKIGYWLHPEYITVNYGLVVTDKDDEKIYTLPKVEIGDKTKEQEEKEKLRKAAQEKNGDFYEGSMYDRFDGLELLESYSARKKNKSFQRYHTDETAKKINAENEKKREAFIQKLANTCKAEMFDHGEIARLTPDRPSCTFRLVINNNESLDADRMAMLLSHQDEFEAIDDSSKLELEYVYVYPLPDRLKSAERDASSFSGRLNSTQRPRVKLVCDMKDAMDVRRIPSLKDAVKTVKGIASPIFRKKDLDMVIENPKDNQGNALEEDREAQEDAVNVRRHALKDTLKAALKRMVSPISLQKDLDDNKGELEGNQILGEESQEDSENVQQDEETDSDQTGVEFESSELKTESDDVVPEEQDNSFLSEQTIIEVFSNPSESEEG